MSVLKAQVIFPGKSGLPSDQYVNTFHFGTDGDDDVADAALAGDAAVNFFANAHDAGNANPIRTYLSNVIDRTKVQVKVYRLNDPAPRVPIYTWLGTIGVLAADGLPSEVAVCLSYRGAVVSGEDMAHRRNRIFVGPLGGNANQADAVPPRPVANLQTAIRDSALWLMGPAFPAGGPSWIVYSPTLGLANTRPVAGGWIDNAFDTQRRRGEKASARVLFGA